MSNAITPYNPLQSYTTMTSLMPIIVKSLELSDIRHLPLVCKCWEKVMNDNSTLIDSNLLFGSVTKPLNRKIVIIGAGIGGLTTAYQLYKCGLDVEVYEARNRVGGRIFTAFINDKIVEFGGQNIHDGGRAENIHKLIDELDLSTTSRKG